jgi:hypothetical protein
MLRSFLRVGALGAVLASAGACHLLLEGQDAGPGSGAGNQGGSGGASNPTAMTTTSTMDTGTTDATTATVSSSSSTGGGTCIVMDEATCVVPADSQQTFYFDEDCEHPAWCYYPTAQQSVLAIEDGELRITADADLSMGNGWWVDPVKEWGPLLYKRITGDFVVVAELSVSGPLLANCPGPYTGYKAGGLLLRNDTGQPATPERFYKLEYGCLGDSEQGDPGFGTLWAQVADTGAAHLGVVSTAGQVDDVGLAICREGNSTEFFFRPDGNWALVPDTNMNKGSGDPMAITTPQVGVGVFAGTFDDNGQSTTVAFEYVGFRTGNFQTGGCLAEVQSLDDDLMDGR